MPAQARRQPKVAWHAFARRAWQMARLWPLALVASLSVAQAEVISARYADPTDRYAHGVLGDAIEWGTLELRIKNKPRLRIILPETRVFEDLEPRLFDVDLDGDLEVIVIESNATQGARLAIYDENGFVAANPYIGTRNRWLAPVGAADLDGDGKVEIAYIDRPHLAKTLRIWRFENGALSEVAQKAGLTNHRIGQDFISSGIRDCGAGPEMVTADANWRSVVISRFDGRTIQSQAADGFSQSALADVLACK
ncbi:FG-GAP repeat domain-containing protein [Cognatishimia sp.]|uniref:FG-GAP repeat domain-containing protein n=1 Tax=Cognatishimia sp. TaxID=2211648 RepID=UPI0035143FB4